MTSDSSSVAMVVSPADFPTAYRYANHSAENWQLIFRLLIATTVTSTFGIALVSALVQSRNGVFIIFPVAVLHVSSAVVIAHSRWNHNWYLARALAESVKTLTWRFAVGGAPFPKTLQMEQARTALERSISCLVPVTVGNHVLGPETIDTDEPLVTFSNLRDSDLETRTKMYTEHRLHNQFNWYSTSASRLARLRHLVNGVMLISSVLTLVLAGLLLIDRTVFDRLWILCAAVISLGSVAVGMSMNLHSDISAYRLTQFELERVLISEPPTDEASWSLWVDDVEEVISREHVLWLASRNTVNGA